MKISQLAIYAMAVCSSHALAQPIPAGAGTISDAMRMIVPYPFEVTIDDRVPPDTIVRWSAADEWIAALHSIADQAQIRVLPFWQEGRIEIHPALVASPAEPVLEEGHHETSWESDIAAGESIAAAVIGLDAAALPEPAVTQPIADDQPGFAPERGIPPSVASLIETEADTAPVPPEALTPELDVASSVHATSEELAVEEPEEEPMGTPEVVARPVSTFTAVAAAVVATEEPAGNTLPESSVQRTFTVTKEDRTIRETLQRWAAQVGWQHEPEHWQAPRDLPVISGGSYTTDFRSAVRILLDSSRFTDMPVHPCFHSNMVVRVVPEAELCNKAAR